MNVCPVRSRAVHARHIHLIIEPKLEYFLYWSGWRYCIAHTAIGHSPETEPLQARVQKSTGLSPGVGARRGPDDGAPPYYYFLSVYSRDLNCNS
jgi:hypothetical protein